MFDELSQRFEDAVKSLRGQDTITEGNVDGALKQVRRALLEADVSLEVIKGFIADVRQKAIGAEVVRGSARISSSSSWCTRRWWR